jgi:hypothetical protein
VLAFWAARTGVEMNCGTREPVAIAVAITTSVSFTFLNLEFMNCSPTKVESNQGSGSPREFASLH